MNALLFHAFARIFVRTFLVPSAVGVLWVIIFLQITRRATVRCVCCVISYTIYPCCSKIRPLFCLFLLVYPVFHSLGPKFNSTSLHKRELKQSRRRRLWEPLRVILHALLVCLFLVHFAAVLVQSTTWKDMEDVKACRQMFTFFLLSANLWYQFNSRIVTAYFARITTWM